MKRSSLEGFTFIELLITLSIIAIAFLPLINMFSVSLEQVYQSGDLSCARRLAQAGMESFKNLGFTQAQLEELGDTWEPDLDSPPIEINNKKWRIQREIIRGTDPLEIHILVYKIPDKPGNLGNEKPIVNLVTLMEDLDWSSAG